MLLSSLELMGSPDTDRLDQLKAIDNEVDGLHTRIKLYLLRLQENDDLPDKDKRRLTELLSFCINLEHIGDIVVASILPMANSKLVKRIEFSEKGWDEIQVIHDQLMQNFELSTMVVVSGDLESARALFQEKRNLDSLEQASNHAHFQRVQTGAVESIETSGMHLDLIHAFVHINRLVCTTAESVLNESGLLLDSRLKST